MSGRVLSKMLFLRYLGRIVLARNLLGYTQKEIIVGKTKVLIVDDDIASSRLLALGLEKTGLFSARVENDPLRAPSTAREYRPEMILLDVCMPGADGGDVAFRIHSDSSLSSTPIVFLTSLVSGQEASTESVMRGGYEFLSKPVNIAKVIECIDRHLGRTSSAPNPIWGETAANVSRG
jgi:two-component system response regulator MtrA